MAFREYQLCFFFVAAFVQGAKADADIDAVIAASVVAGILLLIVISVLVFFAIKCNGKKKPKHVKKTPHSRAVMQHPTLMSQKSRILEIPKVHESPKGKAFTQHAASPRQRPPVLFYTMAQAPRVVGVNHMDLLPMGPYHPYRAAPNVGQPVVFLDWMGGGVPRANGPHITEVPSSEDKSHQMNRESHRRKRSRSRSKSRSRSRSKSLDKMAAEDSGHHSHNETDESAQVEAPNNFILTKKDIDLAAFSRNTDNNNNNDDQFEVKSDSDTMEHFLLERMSASRRSVKKDQDFVFGEGPFSVTQMRSSYRAGDSGSPVQEQETTINFDADEDEKNETETDGRPPLLKLGSLTDDSPRPDYSLNITKENTNTRILTRTESLELKPTPRVDYGADLNAFSKTVHPRINDPSPRIDYSMDALSKSAHPRMDNPPVLTPRVDYSEQGTLPGADDLDDIIEMGKSTNPELQTETESGLFPLGSSTARNELSSTRATFSAMERLDNLARSPSPPPLTPHSPPPPPPPPSLPPPPLPSTSGKIYRAPTPPPGRKIQKEGFDIDDIILLGESMKPSTTQNVEDDRGNQAASEAKSSHGKKGGLPFMAELLRRQSRIDESLLPPPTPQSMPSELPSSRFQGQREDQGNDGLFLGMSSADLDNYRRASAVQFARDPPEIIPDADYPDSPSDLLPQSHREAFGASGAPSPPPPPPPPPPGPPPPLSGAGIPVLY